MSKKARLIIAFSLGEGQERPAAAPVRGKTKKMQRARAAEAAGKTVDNDAERGAAAARRHRMQPRTLKSVAGQAGRRAAGAVALAWLAFTKPPARAEPPPEPVPYLFLDRAADQDALKPADNLERRIKPPAGCTRPELPVTSFGNWLRHLPVFPAGSPVRLYNGELKGRQDVHAAVVVIDVGKRDLQQCADAVMRLRAEYLLARGKPQLIRFHPDPGRPTELAYSGHTREAFNKYLTRVFAEAGSASLQAELVPVRGPVQPGDVLIQGGHPGHAVQVLDVAEGGGKRYLLLGQSFMPAQQLHVLKNLGVPTLSPWFDEAELDRQPGLVTPEWLPFGRKDVRRFPRLPGVD